MLILTGAVDLAVGIRHELLELFLEALRFGAGGRLARIPISQIGNIKAGADWTTEDGKVVPNQQLVYPAETPRSYAYCSDTRYMPDLGQRIRGVTALYHESTYADDNLLMAEKYFHSTARQAALVARDAQARQLILGHYSSRYEDENILLDEARQVFESTILADENMVVNL